MNFRLRGRCTREQEIEIAAFVGLADMLRKHRAIAALVMRLRRGPGGTALCKLLVGDMQVNAASGDIDLDLVAGLHQSQRPADKTLRCHMQDASAVTGA